MTDEGRGPILVIDDDSEFRGTVAEALRSAGYRVVEAEDGSAALHLLVDSARVLPKLIILDMVIPAMSGWEFLTILKTYVNFSRIPVVIMSGVNPNPHTVERGAVGAWLRKPYKLDELIALVNEHVPRLPAAEQDE
jgi:putative two-component system response regulator